MEVEGYCVVDDGSEHPRKQGYTVLRTTKSTRRDGGPGSDVTPGDEDGTWGVSDGRCVVDLF